MIIPSVVSAASSCCWPISLARPKSVILGVPSFVEQDVGRLEVAMDDAD